MLTDVGVQYESEITTNFRDYLVLLPASTKFELDFVDLGIFPYGKQLAKKRMSNAKSIIVASGLEGQRFQSYVKNGLRRENDSHVYKFVYVWEFEPELLKETIKQGAYKFAYESRKKKNKNQALDLAQPRISNEEYESLWVKGQTPIEPYVTDYEELEQKIKAYIGGQVFDI